MNVTRTVSLGPPGFFLVLLTHQLGRMGNEQKNKLSLFRLKLWFVPLAEKPKNKINEIPLKMKGKPLTSNKRNFMHSFYQATTPPTTTINRRASAPAAKPAQAEATATEGIVHPAQPSNKRCCVGAAATAAAAAEAPNQMVDDYYLTGISAIDSVSQRAEFSYKMTWNH